MQKSGSGLEQSVAASWATGSRRYASEVGGDVDSCLDERVVGEIEHAN